MIHSHRLSVLMECGTVSLSLTGWTRHTAPLGLMLLLCLGLQGCGHAPSTPQLTQATPVPPPAPRAPAPAAETPPPPRHMSDARTPGEYRVHAARHVYNYHAPHIFPGPMPPLLQAVGVLDIEIGSLGEVRRLNWLRAPTHAPDVMRQIEELIRRAAPYPAPRHLPGVTYTDTWLWHHSGRFQLHTLSEGQLGESVDPSVPEPKRRTARRTPTPAPQQSAKCAHPSPPPGPISAYC